MKAYDIYDRYLERSLGTLLYYEKSKTFIIELMEDLDEWTAPLLLTPFVKRRIYSICREASFDWVKERVIPSGRQNIGAILTNHHLKEYDEMKLLELSRGICCQDECMIRKLDELPAYVVDRASHHVRDVVALSGRCLLCMFMDGTTRRIDLQQYDSSIIRDVEKVTGHEHVFRSVEVGAGGHFITFNNSIDIQAELLYELGDEVPFSAEDLCFLIERNVLDTTEACDYLACTRQNLNYLVKNEQIQPVKTGGNGNLYLRGELQKNKW
ncbi:MAG: DUF2442 domain-containing protein [Lachnospiraceae bacterium]|nr:DUF2442 domain-containing protein [Lachnospiraceae bacterium]